LSSLGVPGAHDRLTRDDNDPTAICTENGLFVTDILVGIEVE
jgi:hypothetical protein